MKNFYWILVFIHFLRDFIRNVHALLNKELSCDLHLKANYLFKCLTIYYFVIIYLYLFINLFNSHLILNFKSMYYRFLKFMLHDRFNFIDNYFPIIFLWFNKFLHWFYLFRFKYLYFIISSYYILIAIVINLSKFVFL